MRFVYDDGGRAAAGFKGVAGDCVTRAIAIVTGLPYREVYDSINDLAKSERPRKGAARSSARTGVHKWTYAPYLEGLGWHWYPTMQIGQGCKVHLREDELPGGRIIVRLSHHLTAVIDRVIHDITDPSRGGSRCVYGAHARRPPRFPHYGKEEQ